MDRDLSGPGILCKAAPPPRPLWGGMKKEAGSRTELCNQLPQSQRPWHVTAHRFGERLGEGKQLSFLFLLPLIQILANLCIRRCFPSTPAPRRYLPLGVGNQEWLLLSECVKQWPAGFPGRKPVSKLLTGNWEQGLRERGLWLSTPPTHSLGFLPPMSSPLPSRKSTMGEGPKRRRPRLPQHHTVPPLLSPEQSHFPFLLSYECLLWPKAGPHPAVCTVQDRAGGRGCGREGAETEKLRSTTGLE